MSLPGAARSSAISSPVSRAGSDRLPTNTKGDVPIRVMGTKSAWLSYVTTDGETSLAIAIVLSTDSSSV